MTNGESVFISPPVMGAAFPTTCSECVLSVFIAGVMDESLSSAVECLLLCLGDVFHPTVLVSGVETFVGYIEVFYDTT